MKDTLVIIVAFVYTNTAWWLGLKRNAATRGVPMELLREEFVKHTVQRWNDAVTMDVKVMPGVEEFVLRMAQRRK
jgi:hypothetical protein